MRIQHNIPAMNAYRNFKTNNSGLSKNLEKLSSGYKINRAGDDAAGLAISEKMRAQISGLEVASKNAKDGISLVQTAEGALTEVHDMLNRMVTLAEQSANGTYSDDVDRAQLQKEVDELRSEINRIADSANFNGIKLLDGSMDSTNAIEATSTTTITTNFGKFTAFGAASGSATDKIASVGTTLGVSTILHKEAPNAGNSSFTVNLNNYSVDAEGDITVTIAGATDGGTAITTPLTFAVTASDVASGATLDGAALVQKIVEAAATTDSDGNEVNQITFGGKTYDVSADGNKLKFEATSKGELPVDLKVTVSYVGGSVGDPAYTPGDETLATVSAFTWGSDVTTTQKSAFIGSSGSLAIGFNVSIAPELATVSKSTDSAVGATVMGKLSIASIEGITITKATAASTFKFVATTGATLATTDTVTLKYAVSASRTVEFEVALSSLGIIADVTDSASGTTDAGDLLDVLKKAYYEASAGYDANDTITIAASAAAPAGYKYVVATASGSNVELTTSDLTVGTATGNVAATNGKITVSVVATDATDASNPIATFTVNVGNAPANETKGVIASATDAAASFELTDATNPTVKLTFSATAPVTADYNVSTENNVSGVAAAGTRLASTMLTLASSGGSFTGGVFADKIKDGAALKIGDETYIFAVGADSTLQDSENGKLVDLKDIEIASGATALASDDLKTALQRLTVAAKDNAMFGVGYDKASNKMTLVEKEDYYDGTNTLLNSAKVIASQLAWGEVNAKNAQTETVSTTAAVVAKDLTLQIGDTAESFNQLTVSIKDMHTSAMGVLGSDGKVVDGKSLADIDVSTQEGAQEAVDIIKSAINYVSDMRGTLGATQNRLDHTINNLSVMVENITDAESTIRDTDIAEEMMTYTKNSILNQAAQAMLAQANQLPQGVLQLLQ